MPPFSSYALILPERLPQSIGHNSGWGAYIRRDLLFRLEADFTGADSLDALYGEPLLYMFRAYCVEVAERNNICDDLEQSLYEIPFHSEVGQDIVGILADKETDPGYGLILLDAIYGGFIRAFKREIAEARQIRFPAAINPDFSSESHRPYFTQDQYGALVSCEKMKDVARYSPGVGKMLEAYVADFVTLNPAVRQKGNSPLNITDCELTQQILAAFKQAFLNEIKR